MSALKTASLTDGPITRALVRLSVPIILTNLLQTGYNLTDAFWVGRLGASAVAAVSISFPLTFLVIALGSGWAMAGATLSAQYMGAGRKEQVNHVAAQSLLMSLVVSIVLAGLGFLAAPLYLRLLGVDAEVENLALGFVKTAFVGLPFVFVFIMYQALMRGIGKTRLPLLIVAGTVLLNFVLDPLFMFGGGPMPKLGVMGAALATLVTQMFAGIIGICSFLKGNQGIHLKISNFRPDAVYIKRAFLLGYPGSIELAGRAVGVAAMSFLVSRFGTVTIAAYGVGSNILQFITIPAMGISMAVATIVGQNMGARKMERAGSASRVGIGLSAVFLSFLGLIVFVFANQFVAFFVPTDTEVIGQGARFLRIMCLTWGGIGMQLCATSTFRASGNMVTAMALALVSQWVVQFPLALVLSHYTMLGAEGIWWTFPISNVVLGAISIYWLSRGTWMKTRLTDEDRRVAATTEDAIIEEGIPRI